MGEHLEPKEPTGLPQPVEATPAKIVPEGSQIVRGALLGFAEIPSSVEALNAQLVRYFELPPIERMTALPFVLNSITPETVNLESLKPFESKQLHTAAQITRQISFLTNHDGVVMPWAKVPGYTLALLVDGQITEFAADISNEIYGAEIFGSNLAPYAVKKAVIEMFLAFRERDNQIKNSTQIEGKSRLDEGVIVDLTSRDGILPQGHIFLGSYSFEHYKRMIVVGASGCAPNQENYIGKIIPRGKTEINHNTFAGVMDKIFATRVGLKVEQYMEDPKDIASDIKSMTFYNPESPRFITEPLEIKLERARH